MWPVTVGIGAGVSETVGVGVGVGFMPGINKSVPYRIETTTMAMKMMSASAMTIILFWLIIRYCSNESTLKIFDCQYCTP